MPDGSVVLVEMFGPRLTRVRPDGSTRRVAEIPGGPNGAAVGPDGAIYVCNNGGCFTPVELRGLLLPGPFDPRRYIGGRIQRVDAARGEVTDLYTECDGRPLRAPERPRDGRPRRVLVHRPRHPRHRTAPGPATSPASTTPAATARRSARSSTRSRRRTASACRPTATTLYWAETHTGRVFRRRIVGPGELAPAVRSTRRSCCAGCRGSSSSTRWPSTARAGSAWRRCSTAASRRSRPTAATVEFLPTGDPLTTNLCFGGEDLRTAYITLSGTGRLVATPWPAGLRLAHQ